VKLQNSQHIQNDKDERDDEQCMDEVTGFGNTRTDVAAQKAEQPQDEQNDNNSPQHEISPSLKSPIGNPICW
jgi:hypothetical protein